VQSAAQSPITGKYLPAFYQIAKERRPTSHLFPRREGRALILWCATVPFCSLIKKLISFLTGLRFATVHWV